ncbi:MAG: AraC family transcriptional regulator [Bacteroidales bacterium]|jgi:AraC-like DNA-binding protein/Tfp pilus assembly protein PilF|nr:AraC family transcriptional regulator [Bacteroidales bacterium]
MQKKYLVVFSFIFFSIAPTANGENSDIISNFKHLPSQQLLDTANYYFKKNSTDTALVLYSLLINTIPKNSDIEHQKIIADAYNQSAAIYYNKRDFRAAYELLTKMLLLCEKHNYVEIKPKIYTNIGNIYFRFQKYDLAKSYYLKALDLCQDVAGIILILNNIGANETQNKKIDSAFHYLHKSLQISEQHNDFRILYSTWYNFALLYKEKKLYDSAYYYYQLSLNEAKKNNKIEKEAENLSQLGELFFEINKIDSALFYINLSNAIARENNFLNVLATNYFTLSKIERSKGNKTRALELFEKYADLKDSISDIEKFSDISQLQHLYEIAKTNEQIEQLVVKQKIRDLIMFTILGALFLVSIVLLYIFAQKRKLNTAYKVLVEKNLEIIEFQENSSEKYPEKYKKSALTQNMQDELLDRILPIMEDMSIICDVEFSVDKLAELVHSNQKYVSQVINNVLKRNFRSFLNTYRIREAQRLFSEPDAAKYTIDSIALRLGYKSPSTFRDAFKEITGVSPNFYLKSIQNG